MAKWWCVSSLLVCLAVATVAARGVPASDDCDTVAAEAGRDGAGLDEAKTVFGGSNDGGGVNGGSLGSGIAGFGPHGGFGAGAGPFGGFGGGFGAGGGGGGGGGEGGLP